MDVEKVLGLITQLRQILVDIEMDPEDRDLIDSILRQIEEEVKK